MVWEGNKKKGNWADESSLIESSSWRKLVFDVLTDGLCNISVTVAPCNTGNRNDSRVHVCLSHHQGRTCLLQQRWTRQTERTQQDETQGSVWPSNLSETHHTFIERFCFTYTLLWILLVDKKKTTTDDNTLSKTSRKRTLVVRCKYRFLLRARSSPETPLRCAPPPRGGATLLTESTAADGCLKTHVNILL